MALAFKRTVAEAEKAVESANKTIKDTYKTSVEPALVVDFEGIKAVEGVSTQNSNKAELPKNITLCNWIKEYASRFSAVWGDIQYKDKKYALLSSFRTSTRSSFIWMTRPMAKSIIPMMPASRARTFTSLCTLILRTMYVFSSYSSLSPTHP